MPIHMSTICHSYVTYYSVTYVVKYVVSYIDHMGDIYSIFICHTYAKSSSLYVTNNVTYVLTYHVTY